MPDEPDSVVFSTPKAHAYVGGKQFFNDLLEAYPQFLKPIRECKPTGKNAKGKTSYWKETIDQALKAAQMEQRFVKN